MDEFTLTTEEVGEFITRYGYASANDQIGLFYYKEHILQPYSNNNNLLDYLTSNTKVIVVIKRPSHKTNALYVSNRQLPPNLEHVSSSILYFFLYDMPARKLYPMGFITKSDLEKQVSYSGVGTILPLTNAKITKQEDGLWLIPYLLLSTKPPQQPTPSSPQPIDESDNVSPMEQDEAIEQVFNPRLSPPNDSSPGIEILRAFQSIVRRYKLLKEIPLTSNQQNKYAKYTLQPQTDSDVTDYWLMQYFFPPVSVLMKQASPSALEWVAKREKILLRMQLKQYCNREEDILRIVEKNWDSLSLHKEKPTNEYNTLFKKQFPGKSLPTVWFSIDYKESPELLDNHYAILRKGRFYISWIQLVDVVLPQYLYRSIILRGNENINGKIIQNFLQIREETIDMLPWRDAWLAAEKMMHLIQRASTSQQIKTANNTTIDLPPIEDCFNPNSPLAPLCQLSMNSEIEQTGQLGDGHMDRLNFNNFLYHCGYSGDNVVAYSSKQYRRDLLKERINDFKGGKGRGSSDLVFIPCNGYASEKYAGKRRCPYVRLQGNDLAQLIATTSSNLTDKEVSLIVSKAPNYSEACLTHFKLLHNNTPPIYRFVYPRDYFMAALSSRQTEKKTI